MILKKETHIFNFIGYNYVTLLAIMCLIPFWLIITGSLSSEKSIYDFGYSFIPKDFSLKAYGFIFKNPEKVINAYLLTIMITIVGTFLSVFVTSMTAYVLQRKDFKYRNIIAFYLYFTTLFSGGLVPFYIMMVKYLKLKDNILSLILPPMLSVFLILIMRNFLKSIPYSMQESGKIDGAGDFKMFISIILPLSKPGLATIGLFSALTYWNDWYHAMLFIENQDLIPLQYFLHKLLNSIKMLEAIARGAKLSNINLPSETMKLAMAVVVTGPVLLFYPFVQKYFVKGIIIGAVKG